MKSSRPPDPLLIDIFWIQIIQAKMSGENLYHKKSLLTPGWNFPADFGKGILELAHL